MNKEKKIGIVTASTRGIGLSCAKKLAMDGIKVYLAVRRLEAGEDIVREIKESGGDAASIYFNASEESTYSSIIDDIFNKEGRIDILVNNYGITDVEKDKDVLNSDVEDFLSIVNENLRSVYVPSQTAIKYMIKAGGGSIINISSVGSVNPDLSRTAYGVSKAAINFLTKNIAVQYASLKIRCNAVLPGYIETDATKNNMSQEFLNQFLRTVPLSRVGKPEDIANMVSFLASDKSSFITGECISVSGGFGIPTPMYPLYMDMKNKG